MQRLTAAVQKARRTGAVQEKLARIGLCTDALLARGNFRSTFIVSGRLRAGRAKLFNDDQLDGYFLEYDFDRAGGFEPLRFFPKGNKQLVLGVVTSKSGTLESKDAIKRRIDEATKYVALDQLCLSPQCGFASTEEGNVLSEDAAVGQAADDRGTGRRGLGAVSSRSRARKRGEVKRSKRSRDIMQRTKPPFRADHVGSLLRSAALKEARAKREKNEITAEQLKAVEDREIEAIIKKQEAVGLKSITDGEYRRAFWNYDFLGKLDGVEAYLGERKIKFQGKQPEADDAARHRQARLVHGPSDDRAFQVRASRTPSRRRR